MSDISGKEKRNYAYFQLVDQEQPNDFIGMIAYTIYKKNKVEYITKFRNNHNGSAPTDEQLSEWQQSQCTTQQLELYKERATTIITAFINDIIDSKHLALKENEENNIKQRELLDKREKELEEKEKSIKKRESKVKLMEKICPSNKNKIGTYIYGVSQSFIATLLYVIITIIIFTTTKWPLEFLTYFIESVNKNIPK